MSPSDLMGNYPHMVVMGTGLAFGFLVVRLSYRYCFLICENWQSHIGVFVWQGRMILSHLCDEPKGLKTSMCVVRFIVTA